jgi:hypothetical protein
LVAEAGEMDRGLTATDIHGLCEGGDIQIPGLRPGSDEDKGKKVIGTIMGKLFRERGTIDVGGFTVTREEKYIARDNASDGGSFKSKTYAFSRAQ